MEIKTVRRFWRWLVCSAVLVAIVAYLAPQQVGLLLFKVLQVSLGVVVAYLADKVLFRHAPPVNEALAPDAFGGARLLSRAVLAGAVIIGVTLGI